MGIVSITAVEPGQVVARPVTTPEGLVLCPAGFTLTASVIQRLKNAGIETVAIEGTDDRRLEVEGRLADLEARFSGISDPLMLQIRSAAERRIRALLAPDA